MSLGGAEGAGPEPRKADPGEPDRDERMAFILGLRRRGFRDVAVLRAMELVPRALFVDPALRRHAYDDVALPIACGQTMSQPSVVAAMTGALQVTADHAVLEVGTGSGYQAAVLSHLASRVVTVERYRALVAEAHARFNVLGLRNVVAYAADGALGMAARGPFDRVMITAAVAGLPPAIVDQVRTGGVIVAPMIVDPGGDPSAVQTLTRFVKTAGGLERSEVGPVRFVPLMPGAARLL